MRLPEGDQLLLIHNPNCSKSRAALTFMESQERRFEVLEYLGDPPSVEQLLELGRRLNLPLAQWCREAEWVQSVAGLPLDEANQNLAQRMAQEPHAIQRPILVSAELAAIGRPLEAFGAVLQ